MISSARPLPALAALLAIGCSGDRASGRDIEVDEPPAEPTACEMAEQVQPARIESIAAGYETTCAVTNTGHMYCWGYSDMGIAGHPELGVTFCTARRAPEHRCAKQVSLGKTLACGSTFDGRASCWGEGFGPYPIEVPGLLGVSEVATMDSAGAALLYDGTLRLWGNHVADAPPLAEPTNAFPELTDVTGLSTTGRTPYCVTRASGRVTCWILRTSAVTSEVVPPEELLGVQGALEVAASYQTCARTAEGDVWCRGEAPLGDGTTEHSFEIPVQVVGLDSATQISTDTHACAVAQDGSVSCWGQCTSGACGEDASGDVLTPHRVEGLPPAIQVTVGWWYTCALTVEREVYCWGHRVKCEPGTKVDTPIPQNVVFSDPIE